MKVDLSGTQEVAVPRDRVWDLLLDPAFIASCTPEVESVETVGKNRFRATAGLGVGPIKVRFRLDVSLCDLVPCASVTLQALGKAPGTEVRADGTLVLKALSPTNTLVRCTATAEVTGMLVAVAARNLASTAQSVTAHFWRTFAERALLPASPP